MVSLTGIGYIGAALAEALLADGEHVVGLENGFSTNPSVMTHLSKHPRFTLIRGSILNVQTLVKAFGAAGGPVDAVYHLAAQASAHPQAAPPAFTEQTNLMAPRLVYEAAVTHDAKALVHGSSFRVLGDSLADTVAEDAPYGYISDLSHLSKVYVEKLFEMLAGQPPAAGATPIPVANVRLGVVYGLGPVMKHDPRFLTVPNLFCLRTAAGQQLHVHAGANRPIGFLHLDDAVQALRRSADLARARGSGSQIVNAVSEVLGVGEVAAIVEQTAQSRGLTPQIEGAGPLTGPRWSVTSSLEAAGFRPTRTMAESLPTVLDYYLKRPVIGDRRQ